MLNRIILIGRLTRDPESSYTSSGIQVAKFRIAVDRPTRNPETNERETDFIDVVAWRQRAEFVSKYISKGRLVAVEGRLQIRTWTGQDGAKRWSTEVVADNVEGLDRPRDSDGAPPPAGDDAGASPTGAPATPTPQAQAEVADGEEYDPFADE